MLNMIIFASCLIVPVILAIIFQGIVYNSKFLKKKKIIMTDLLYPFFIVAIHLLSKICFDESVILYFCSSLMMLGIGLAIYQGFAEGEILYGRFFKMFWRIGFVLALVIYVLLIGFGIYFLFFK